MESNRRRDDDSRHAPPCEVLPGFGRHMPTGCLALDEDGVVLHANSKGAEFFGRIPCELAGKPLESFLPSGQRSSLHAFIRKTLEAKESVADELLLPREPGHGLWLKLTAVAAMIEGRLVVHLAVTDISDLKKLERELAAMASFSEESPNPVLRLDSRGAVLFANPSSQILLEAWRMQTGGMPPSEIVEAVRHAIATNANRQMEVRVDGSTFALLFVPATRGEYVNVFSRDISEFKRIEGEMKRLNEELERRVAERTAELSNRMDQLRALASELTQAEERERRRLARLLHDGPQQLITSAKMQLELARRRSTGGEDHLRFLSRGIELLDESMNDLRSLNVELSPPVLYDAGFVAALQWLGRWMREKHGLAVEIDADPEAEPSQESISVFLFQAVRELLFNVVKHSGADSARITMRRGKGDEAVVVVEDKGVGFDGGKDALAVSGTPGGFGLLSIRERLSMMDGHMEIASKTGEGSRITLRVPALRGKEGVAPVRQTGGGAAPVTSEKGKIRVLVVDDHNIMRKGLINLLQNEQDLEVAGEAGDAEQALKEARRLNPDVVVMDVSMPGVSGVEATRWIKTELPQIKVVGLSMHEMDDMAGAMLRAGASAYVTKGGPSENLLQAIRGD